MPEPKNCETCTWWSFVFKDGNKEFGTCSNLFVEERLRVTQDYDSNENDDPTIFTEAMFGCVYQEIDGDKTLLKIYPPH